MPINFTPRDDGVSSAGFCEQNSVRRLAAMEDIYADMRMLLHMSCRKKDMLVQVNLVKPSLRLTAVVLATFLHSLEGYIDTSCARKAAPSLLHSDYSPIKKAFICRFGSHGCIVAVKMAPYIVTQLQIERGCTRVPRMMLNIFKYFSFRVYDPFT